MGGRKHESAQLKPSESGKLIDTTKCYVIAIDPLSNGVSSSPSDSKLQPRMKFPIYTIRDVVNAEYAFLTKSMGITHVKCVMGVSMGMPTATRETAAGFCTNIRVDAKFQAFSVNIVAQCFHPRREALSIWLTETSCIPRSLPAVINHNILIRRILHSTRYDRVSGFTDQFFVNIASKAIQLFQPIGDVAAN